MLKPAITFIACLLLVTAAALAQDEPIFGLVTAANIEVRVGPDFAYDTIGRLPRNASVVVTGRGNGWYQIEVDSLRGWIYARYLRTSETGNTLPVIGGIPPRNRDGRVPEEFDLSSEICSQWAGDYGVSGSFMAGDQSITVSYPALQGANLFLLTVTSPTGFRTSFESLTTSATLELEKLPAEPGSYQWQVAPYWSNGEGRYDRQRVCPFRIGGSFEKPQN